MPIAPQITNTPVDITSADFAITAVSYTSSTATYTASGHTFSAGDTVIVSGIVPAGYSGTFTISSVVAGTSFTCANTTNLAVTTATGDAFTANATDFTYSDVQQVRIADNVDVANAASAAAQAEADAQTAIANAATAISTANAANAAATSAAYAAGVAQTTANGKNTSHYSTSGPSGGGIAGDLWFQVNGGGTVLYQYAYDGSSWVAAPISNTVISNLDAGKITAGTITGIAYNNGSGTFSVSPSGVLVASSATITGNITATSGTFTGTVYASSGTFTGTVTATSGSFTGSIYASSGTVGGFTITNTNIYSANLNIANSGTISGGNSQTIYYGYGNFGGGSNTGGYRLYVTGTSGLIGDTTVTGYIYNPGYATTVSAANAYINSSTGLLARSSSSLRYKVDAQPQTIPVQSILQLTPKSFFDKAQADEKGTTNGLPRILGLIAEEVAQIPVIADFLMNKNDQGEPDSVNYDRVAIALLPLLQDHEARLNKLEGK